MLLQDTHTEPALILHWVPNTTIWKNPKSVDTSKNSSMINISELTDNGKLSSSATLVDSAEEVEPHSTDTPDTSSDNQLLDLSSSNEFLFEPGGCRDADIDTSDSGDDLNVMNTSHRHRKHSVTLSNNSRLTNGLIGEGDDCSISSGSTGGPDSDRSSLLGSMSDLSLKCDVISLTSTSESIAETHNLLFPSPVVSRVQQNGESLPLKPSVFSANLGE